MRLIPYPPPLPYGVHDLEDAYMKKVTRVTETFNKNEC